VFRLRTVPRPAVHICLPSGFFSYISHSFPRMRDEIEVGEPKSSPRVFVCAACGSARARRSPTSPVASELRKNWNRSGRDRTVRTGGNRVIRQAISCDICGNEKKQTNHWFVAYDQGGELRVSGWNSRNRLRPGSKHLCGQTCLHKLVDDFMAKALTARVPHAAQIDMDDEVIEQAASSDTSLTSSAAYREIESSARLVPTPAPVASAKSVIAPAAAAAARRSSLAVAPVSATTEPAQLPIRMPIELVATPPKPSTNAALVLPEEPPRYASRNWRAAAWEREREREQRSVERRPGTSARHRFMP